jgi:uncharacterized protein (DUF2225 family)
MRPAIYTIVLCSPECYFVYFFDDVMVTEKGGKIAVWPTRGQD